ncbi:GMC oxidoreductase-domain-containing protein [Ephemerocybe angulata]|uniref:GMC oxidoreductase-domain-containing protein n=1 Tax=Ephemerocybe angulata TaxID=980116 RepID=A0A8H6HV48_9AGAR|nr:GMC oxidoreductase-domain-containing protein [Tulosesus angulatus]
MTQTPQLLQVSGVGDPALLQPLGIPVRVNLWTVGKNLHEQLFGSQSTNVVNPIRLSIATWANNEKGSAYSAEALQQIFQIQADNIINNNAPLAEILVSYGYPDLESAAFSRGNVKLKTDDPFMRPQVTVNWFRTAFDLDVQVAAARLARRVLTSPPMSSLSTGETIPGTAVPDNADRGFDNDWKNWLLDNYSAVSHPVGTAAMMRRTLGGVVNAQLKVYDMTNLHVVDASVMPTQISAHLSATLYGIAEKAADLIKASWP